MHMPKLILLTLTALLLLVGCQQAQLNPKNSVVKQSSELLSEQARVTKAFEEADDLQANHSKWFDREEKLPLTIIATAYIKNEVLNTKEYKIYNKFLKQIQKDMTLLDKLSGKNLSSKYSSIKFVDYNSNNSAKEKFTAAYINRYSDKEKLTDILRPDVEKPSQELLIRLNLEELKKGNLTIEGYKTVKQSQSQRNSYYYTLRKTNYSKLNNRQKKQAIADSIIASLQLSIPEYVSIDRKKILKDTEIVRFMTPQSNGLYEGNVWKYSKNFNVNKVKNKLADFMNEKKILQTKKRPYCPDFNNHNTIASNDDGLYGVVKHPINKSDWRVQLYRFYPNEDTIKKVKTLIKKDEDLIEMIVSPNFKFAVSFSENNYKSGRTRRVRDRKYVTTVRYWNLSNGTSRVVKRFKPKTEGYYLVPYSSHFAYAFINNNPKYIMITHEDGSIYKLNLKNGKISLNTTIKVPQFKEESLRNHRTSNQFTMNMSYNYKYLMLGSNGIEKLYNTNKQKLLGEFQHPGGFIKSSSITSDGKYIAVGDINSVSIWEVKTKTLLKKFNLGNIHIHRIDLNKKNSTLYLSVKSQESKDKYSFKVDSKKVLAFQQQQKDITELSKFAETKSKQNILTTPFSEQDFITLKATNYAKSNKLSCLNINKVADTLDAQYADPLLVSIFSGEYASNVRASTYKSTYIVLNKKDFDSKKIYLSSKIDLKDAGYIHITNIKNIPNIPASNEIFHNGEGTNSIAVNDTGSALFASFAFYRIAGKLYNTKSKSLIHTLYNKTAIKNGVISNDAKTGVFYRYKNNNLLNVWDLKNGKKLTTLSKHKEPITVIKMTPDNHYLLSASKDKTLRYWNMKNLKQNGILKGHKGIVSDIQISKNSKYALTSGEDKTIRLWDLEKRKSIKTIKCKYMMINVSMSEDMKYVLSVDTSSNLYLWDMKKNKLIKKINKIMEKTRFASINSDGKFAIIANYEELKYIDLDKEVSIYNLDSYKIKRSRKIWINNISSNQMVSSSENGYGGSEHIVQWNLGLLKLNALY